MLILAGVSISAIVGEDGLLSKAQYAKLASEDAAWFENAEMLLVEAYGDVDKIPDMQAWLLDRFNGISNGDTVCVTPYKDGYLIVSGKRMITVDKDMQITSSRENTYLIATGDDWYFEPNGTGTCKLTAYKLSLTGTITIPSVVTDKESGNVYMVTELADDVFNYATNVTKIDFSASYNLTKIGARTFSMCTNLEINVPDDLPSTITSIGDKAFYSCSKLNGNINTIISHGYTLGKGVFMKCPNLTGEIQAVFDQNFYLDESGNPVATVVEESQFSGYSGLTGSLTIPSYITEIKANAFYGCTSINSLQFEDTVEHPSQCINIGDSAFYGDDNISNSISFPDSIKVIGKSAFENCSKILGITLSRNLEKIDNNAFYNDYEIRGTINFYKKLYYIGDGAFRYDSNIEKLIFEKDNEQILQVGYSAFYGDTKINELILPNKVDLSKANIFTSSKITNLELPDSITKIGESTFFGCKNLNITHWSSSLEVIGANAFSGCGSLTTLPNNLCLISLSNNCFQNCTSIASTDIIGWIENSNIKYIGDGAFRNCINLYGNYDGFIDGVTIEGAAFSGTSVIYEKEIPQDGILCISDNEFAGVGKFLKDYSEVTELTIPNTVTKIGKYAFSKCNSLTKVIIPDSVTEIDNYAFLQCESLKTVEFTGNSKLTNLKCGVFQECSKLSTINLPNSIINIERYALQSTGFENLTLPLSLETLGTQSLFGIRNLTSIILPNNLKTIGSKAFDSTRIVEVDIPDSVTNMENSVFYNLASLKKVTIGKGITKISPYNFYNCSNLEEIDIKGNIVRIDKQAFYNCRSLTKINGIDWKNINYVGSQAFYDCRNLKINILLNAQAYIAEDAFDKSQIVVSK